MALNDSNRYRSADRQEFADGDVLVTPRFPVYSPERDSKVRYYIVKSEDTLDSIAYDLWKDYTRDADKYWWIIAEVNSILDPYNMKLLVGRVLTIPNFRYYQSLRT